MPATINSDDGVVSGSAGLKTTGANDGILALQNNGTTNVTVTTSGSVGVGTTNPNANVLNGTPILRVQGAGAGFVLNDTSSNGSYAFLARTGSSTNLFRIFDNTSGTDRVTIDSAGVFAFNSGYGSAAAAYGCRAWVNFNGTTNTGGFCTIRSSGNVSSVADNGNGDYTVNFATSMPDTNYSTQTTTNRSNGNPTLANISRIADELSVPTTSSIRVVQGVPDAGRALQREDCSIYCVAIFR